MRVPRIIVPDQSQYRLFGKDDPTRYGVDVGVYQPGMFADLAAEAPAHRWDIYVLGATSLSGGTDATDWTFKVRQHTVVEHTGGPMFSEPVLVPFDELRTQTDIVEGVGWYGTGQTAPAHAGEFGIVAQRSTSPNNGVGVLVSRVIRNTARTKLEYDLEFTGGVTPYLRVVIILTPVYGL